jgi:hypothetical protein
MNRLKKLEKRKLYMKKDLVDVVIRNMHLGRAIVKN